MSETVVKNVEKSGGKAKSWNHVYHFATTAAISTTSLSNIWRYPSFTYPEGEGTFLLIYIVVLIILGLPIYYMELILGQFSSKLNSEALHSISHGLVGIGWSQAFTSLCISTYLSTFATYELYYFIRCFSTVLPWTICKSEWNTTCYHSINVTNSTSHMSELLYFEQDILRLNSDLGKTIGVPKLQLVICLFAVWIAVFLFLLDNVTVNQYVVYSMAVFINLSLITLMRRTSYFDVASSTRRYFNIHMSTLLSPKIWYRAVQQCMVSIGLGIGTITTLASRNKFYYQIKSSSLTIIIFHFLSTFLVEMTNASVIGQFAVKLNISTDEIPNSIPWIVFVGYPTVLQTIVSDIPHIYIILFYLMMFASSVGSLYGLQLVVNNHLQYYFPLLKNWQSGLITTLVSFCISIMTLVPGGFYATSIANNYCNQLVLLIILFFIIIAVQYYYGMQNFCWDVEYMSQTTISCYWRICWSVVAPLLIFITLINNIISMKDVAYGIENSVNYHSAGLLVLCLLIPIPGCMLYFRLNTKSQDNEKQQTNWGPVNEEQCNEWKELKLKVSEKRNSMKECPVAKFVKSLWRLYD